MTYPQLNHHPGFQRLFRPGKLTLGFILPLETHPGRPASTMQNHLHMAQRADELGFGGSTGTLDLIPKPLFGRIPSIAVGRSQQSTEWLAHNLDGLHPRGAQC